jgi:hypothetical protein
VSALTTWRELLARPCHCGHLAGDHLRIDTEPHGPCLAVDYRQLSFDGRHECHCDAFEASR